MRTDEGGNLELHAATTRVRHDKALCGHTHVWDAAEKTETPSAGATRGRCRRGRCGRVPCQELCEEAGCRDLGDGQTRIVAGRVVRCAMGHSCGSWVLLKKVGH